METASTVQTSQSAPKPPVPGYRGPRRRTDSTDSCYSSDSSVSRTECSKEKVKISPDVAATTKVPVSIPKDTVDPIVRNSQKVRTISKDPALIQKDTATVSMKSIAVSPDKTIISSAKASVAAFPEEGAVSTDINFISADKDNSTVSPQQILPAEPHGVVQDSDEDASSQCSSGEDSSCSIADSSYSIADSNCSIADSSCGNIADHSSSSSSCDEAPSCNWRDWSDEVSHDVDHCNLQSLGFCRKRFASVDMGTHVNAILKVRGGERVLGLGRAGQIKSNLVSFLNIFQRTIQDPGTQRLTWYKPPLSVLIIKKIFDDLVITPFIELATWLVEKRHMLVFIEKKTFDDSELKKNSAFMQVKHKLHSFKEGEDDLTDKIDFIICLGGDGTLLYASSLFQESVPPVMAFHLGSLGFLGPFDFSNFREKVTQVLEGNAALTLRTRLKCVVNKSGTVCSTIDGADACSIKNVESKQHILVLNEVVVDRGPSPYICNIDLFIEHKYITSVQGDGLIISTPTGSTAYAAAAGASMIHPNVPAILIAPVCPHSLSFRPIVVPAGVEIKIMISPEARSGAWVSFDGRQRQELFKGDVLRISTSIYPVPSICSQDQISDWFESLAGCLHWNVRKQQRAFKYNGASSESLDSSSDHNSNGK